MRIFVGTFGVIILSSKSDIAFLVGPYGKRIPVGDNYPLADIKLFVLNYEWIFDVFLNYPLRTFLSLHVVHYFVVVIKNFNATASRLLTGFNDPEVAVPIQVMLRVFLFHFVQKILNINFQIGRNLIVLSTFCFLNHFRSAGSRKLFLILFLQHLKPFFARQLLNFDILFGCSENSPFGF